VAFTSANGVERTLDALHAARRDARSFGRAKVAAIGPGTEGALRRRGIVADIVAEEYRGEGLADAILPVLIGKKSRVLLLRALVARDALPTALRLRGVEVDVVAAYETRAAAVSAIAALRHDLEVGVVDVVTFTSSSTVRELCAALGDSAKELLSRALVAVIGPITAETARDAGLTVGVEATEYTVPGLLDALERHFSSAT
jgi:uroporphyrinogen III methyltransferase/synthase